MTYQNPTLRRPNIQPSVLGGSLFRLMWLGAKLPVSTLLRTGRAVAALPSVVGAAARMAYVDPYSPRETRRNR